jgi:CheY-like chemotaxis protein
MRVLIAIRDDDVRWALRTLLEDAGCEVVVADRGLTAFTLLARSAQPTVVLLDTHLGDRAAAEQLLSLARAGSPWACHHYVVLSTMDPRHWSPRLIGLVEAEQIPILQLPRDVDWLLPMVSHVQATQSENCGCMALSA